VLPFGANNSQNPRMGFELRKKGKYKRAEKIKKIQGEAKATLAKTQEDIKKYTNRYRSKIVECKVEDLVLLSTKDLKWQIIGQ